MPTEEEKPATLAETNWTAPHNGVSLDAFRATKRFVGSLHLFGHVAAVALSPAFDQAKMDLEAFGRKFQWVAEQIYLRHHRRLPGSLRTCRLRKKRRTVVMAWFEHYSGDTGDASC